MIPAGIHAGVVVFEDERLMEQVKAVSPLVFLLLIVVVLLFTGRYRGRRSHL
jgi:hypothetical protein